MKVVSNRFQSMPGRGSKKNHHRLYLNISSEQFRDEFMLFASEIMEERNEPKTEFIVDNTNRELINQLYYYLVGDKRYSKELKKGLYFHGSPGFGKSIILMSVIRLVEKHTVRRFIQMTAREFCDLIKRDNVYQFKKKTIFVDDIYKEVLEAVWNKHAFIKLVEAQYNYGAWVFWASNYKVETIIKGYGKVTFDRMKSMVNFYNCESESKRR